MALPLNGNGRPHAPADAHRVLIVEDESILAMDIEDGLQEAGYVVVGIANRCSSALNLASAHGPHLVLMDIHLVGQRDGIETARLIRQLHDIPSLFMTAEMDPELVVRSEVCDPVGWLSKPLSRTRLLDAIGLALNGSHLE